MASNRDSRIVAEQDIPPNSAGVNGEDADRASADSVDEEIVLEQPPGFGLTNQATGDGTSQHRPTGTTLAAPTFPRFMPATTYTRPIATPIAPGRSLPPATNVSWVTAAASLPLFSAAMTASMMSSPMATLMHPTVTPYTPITPGNQPYMPYYPASPYGFMYQPMAGNPYSYPYPYMYPPPMAPMSGWGNAENQGTRRLSFSRD